MRPVTVSTSGVSASTPVVLDRIIDPEGCSVYALVTGSATYTVQITGHDPFASDFASATWFAVDDTVLVGATASAFGKLPVDKPATAARVNQTAGSGSVLARFTQAGMSSD